jgi:septum formation protein
MSFILASKSESRRGMLERAGVPFTAQASDVDEEVIKESFRSAGKSVEETALELASAKAAKVSADHPSALVLGADQMLECESRWFDKAKDLDEAREQLRFLSGKIHRLVTAVVLMQGGKIVWKDISEARLKVRTLSEGFIEDYCRHLGEDILKSVGCYALEKRGIQLFDKVDGDFFGILGLPLLPLLQELRAKGMLLA